MSTKICLTGGTSVALSISEVSLWSGVRMTEEHQASVTGQTTGQHGHNPTAQCYTACIEVASILPAAFTSTI